MILDYLWKSLFLGGVMATAFLAAMLLTYVLLKKSNAQQRKWFLNSQLALLAVVLAGGFLWAALDHELTSDCFDIFVRQTSTWIITRWLAGAWIGGLLLLLTRDLWNCLWILRKSRDLRPMTDHAHLNLLTRLKKQVGVRDQVQLMTTDESISPFALGIFHYRIVLPRNGLNEVTLKSALAHELVHVRDRDSAWLFLELFCRRVLFWHPLAYMTSRLYSVAVEKAADETAIRAVGIPVRDFMQSLLEIAALYRRSSLSPVRVNASRGFAEIKGRLEALARPQASGSIKRFVGLALLATVPIIVSIAEARVAQKVEPFDPKMCMQVSHEKLIESWLRIEPAAPRCGK
jgi:beta-lactamase regulating signal transducer with metallopeptidase domain